MRERAGSVISGRCFIVSNSVSEKKKKKEILDLGCTDTGSDIGADPVLEVGLVNEA